MSSTFWARTEFKSIRTPRRRSWWVDDFRMKAFSLEIVRMAHDFKVGDHVEWNSEAGRVRGTIKKRITSEITFKGYTVHASKEEPQYLIKSDKTDHMAMHKGSALT